MGGYNLSKSDEEEVVKKVNAKGEGKWTWIELGEALQEELMDANWRMMNYKDDTTQAK